MYRKYSLDDLDTAVRYASEKTDVYTKEEIISIMIDTGFSESVAIEAVAKVETEAEEVYLYLKKKHDSFAEWDWLFDTLYSSLSQWKLFFTLISCLCLVSYFSSQNIVKTTLEYKILIPGHLFSVAVLFHALCSTFALYHICFCFYRIINYGFTFNDRHLSPFVHHIINFVMFLLLSEGITFLAPTFGF